LYFVILIIFLSHIISISQNKILQQSFFQSRNKTDQSSGKKERYFIKKKTLQHHW